MFLRNGGSQQGDLLDSMVWLIIGSLKFGKIQMTAAESVAFQGCELFPKNKDC